MTWLLESTSFDMAGQHVTSTGHAIDVIRLEGESLLFVRSTAETTTKAEKKTKAKPASKS
jgi:hypothetical protein